LLFSLYRETQVPHSYHIGY